MYSSLSIGASACAGAVAGLGLAAGGYAYAAMWPASRIFGQALVAPPRPGELALTFDDGPNPAWTPRLLDILASHDVRASFFMLGSYAKADPTLVRRIAAAGHLIGNHSWSHCNLAISPCNLIRDQLVWSRDALEQITGTPVRYFRPPFGARRPAVFRVASSLGFTTVLWNAMTSDWSDDSADRIAHRLTGKIDRLARQGWAANIVLHDGGHLDSASYREPSLIAAGMLAAHYKKTHRFVTLDAWS